MHYSDGTEAKVGDLAIGDTADAITKRRPIGYVATVIPGAKTCNMQLAVVMPIPPDSPLQHDSYVLLADGQGLELRMRAQLQHRTISEFTLLYRPEPSSPS